MSLLYETGEAHFPGSAENCKARRNKLTGRVSVFFEGSLMFEKGWSPVKPDARYFVSFPSDRAEKAGKFMASPSTPLGEFAKLSEGQVESLISNSNIKIFMRTEDPQETCLSLQEYEKRIVKLHSGFGMSGTPTKDQDRDIRRQELNLRIDYRLGINFPQERRDALWAIQEQVEIKRARLIMKYFLRKLMPFTFARGANGLADYLVSEYSKVLSDAELTRYFDLNEGERPALPIDMNQIKK